MEDGNIQKDLKEEFPQGQQKLVDNKTPMGSNTDNKTPVVGSIVFNELPKNYGFSDPATLKKAMAASAITRRKGKTDELSMPFKPEEYTKLAEQGCEDFEPTVNMLLVLRHALSLDAGTSRRSWFAKAGVHRNTWYEWIKVPGFSEWWKQSIIKGFKDYEGEWVSIGVRKMRKDTKTWIAMGELFFKYAKTLEVKDNKSPEEEALTKELMELVTGMNLERKSKIIELVKEDTETNGVRTSKEEIQKEITETEFELLKDELEKEKEVNGNG